MLQGIVCHSTVALGLTLSRYPFSVIHTINNGKNYTNKKSALTSIDNPVSFYEAPSQLYVWYSLQKE